MTHTRALAPVVDFTGKPAVGTLGRRLVDEKRLKKLDLLHKRRERLQGAELAAYMAKKLKADAEVRDSSIHGPSIHGSIHGSSTHNRNP